MRNPPLTDAQIESRARRRVAMKSGWYIHAVVFVAVNLGLYVIAQFTPYPRWHHWPLWGWGLGLAIHGLVVWLVLHGDGLRERMLEAERERLRRRG